MKYRKLKFWIATGFGAGLVPFIPGTVAALWGVLIHFILLSFGLSNDNIIVGISLSALILIVLTFKLYDFAYEEWGNHDAKEFILDEIIGYLFTVSWVLHFNKDIDHPLLMFWGFVFFRLFDICKIFPANWIDKNIEGPLGVIGDDVVSGMYAGIIILLIF